MGDQAGSTRGLCLVRKVPRPAVGGAEESTRSLRPEGTCAGSLPPPKEQEDLEGHHGEVVSVMNLHKDMKSRFDSSLFVITRKLMDIIKNAPGGVLHLKKIVPLLGIPKRRLYDITSVLHGINMVERVSKNSIRWIGPDISSFEPSPRQKQLREEITELTAKERALDELIRDCALQLFALIEDQDNQRQAYVTHQDVQNVEAYHKRMAFVVKAPPESMLEIPPPQEDSITMRIRSTRAPIEVFLLEPDPVYWSSNASGGAAASAPRSKPPEQPGEKGSPSQQSEGEVLEVSTP